MPRNPQSTLGYERFCNIFMADRPEDEFVPFIMKTLLPFPDYYRRMKGVNTRGPELLDGIPGGAALSPREFSHVAAESDAVIIDLRRPEAFGGAHIPNSLNIGAGQNLSMWAGWVVPYDRAILLVADEGTDTEETRRSLIRVGFDDIRGHLKGGMRSWIEAGLEQAHIPQQSVRELASGLAQDPFVLDVRSQGEWNRGHIAGARHIPGGDLPKRVGELPADRPLHIICGSGYRSSIATSVLERAGLRNIINVAGGMGAWSSQNFPTEREATACPVQS